MSNEDVPKELEELIKEKVLFCYQCGACVGSCPTSRVISEYNPRKIMEKLILGHWEEVLSGKLIWLCTLCHTCYEVCPQGVGISHIIVVLRNLAAQRRSAPAEFLLSAKQLASTGWTSPITSAVQRYRKELGLPEVKNPETGELIRILESTKLKQLLEG